MDEQTSGRVCSHDVVWAEVAHRQADGREYHPLKLPHRLAATPLQKFGGEFSHNAVWAATAAGDADEPVRWDSCRLDFLFLFDQAKRKEKNHLDSYNAITSSSGKVLQRNHFDAWGNPLPVYASTGQWYEEYDYDDDGRYDDDDGPHKRPSLFDWGASTGLFQEVNEGNDESIRPPFDYNDARDDRNDDESTYDPFSQFDSFDMDGMYGPWDQTYEPVQPNRGGGAGLSHEVVGTTGLFGNVFGGSAAWSAAETAVGSGWTNSLKYVKIGGNLLGGVGTVLTGINAIDKGLNRTLNTADLVDLGASLSLLGAGVLLTNPVGIGVVVIGGVVYGVYRLAAGEQADAWLNSKFGFRK